MKNEDTSKIAMYTYGKSSWENNWTLISDTIELILRNYPKEFEFVLGAYCCKINIIASSGNTASETKCKEVGANQTEAALKALLRWVEWRNTLFIQEDGYKWVRLSSEEAKVFYKYNFPVFVLHPDSESLVEQVEDFDKFDTFGIEDWDIYRTL